MKTGIQVVIGIAGLCIIMYSGYWAAKVVSYEIFYEDMVQETVREMVKPEYLKP